MSYTVEFSHEEGTHSGTLMTTTDLARAVQRTMDARQDCDGTYRYAIRRADGRLVTAGEARRALVGAR